MKRLTATDLSTLALGGNIYDKNNPTLKPEFDQMWKRVTAFAKSLYGILESMNRPYAYEMGKSRNYLQQAGRGKFYYPRFVWIRYIAEGEKRNTPAVSLVIRPDSISFSIDFLGKYADTGNISQESFDEALEKAEPILRRSGYTKTDIDGFPRLSYTYSSESLDEMTDEEFDEEAQHHFSLLFPIYEAVLFGSQLPSELDSELDEEKSSDWGEDSPQPFAAASSRLGTGVAAAALASVRGQSQQGETPTLDETMLTSTGPRTVVRRRRTSTPTPQPTELAPPTQSTIPSEPTRELQTPNVHTSSTNAPKVRRRIPTPPLPAPASPVSIVPPPIPADAPGSDLLRRSPAMVIYGPPEANLYKLVFGMIGALVHDQLCKTKKRHEIILEALDEPTPEDILSLALYSAPRGLSLVALQTHDLMLHYYRNIGTWTQSLRHTIRQCLEGNSEDEHQNWLFEQLPNGSWMLTQEGQRFVETNYRYALQEAGKRKPKRYGISDFAVILGRTAEGFPELYEVMGIREDASGAIKKTVCSGPLVRLIQKAAKKPSIPFAIALVNAEPADIERAFGPLFPLLDPQNRGTGPYAPSIHLPDLGSIAIPPNVHVLISLRAGVELSPEDTERYRRSFRLTNATELMCDVQGSNSMQDIVEPLANSENEHRPRGH